MLNELFNCQEPPIENQSGFQCAQKSVSNQGFVTDTKNAKHFLVS